MIKLKIKKIQNLFFYNAIIIKNEINEKQSSAKIKLTKFFLF